MSGDDHIEELLDGLTDDWKTDLNNRDAGLPGVSVINWRTLTTDEAPATWAQLKEWVDWLIRRYRIPTRRIPPCWYQHGALVEELSALHTAWQISYDPLDAGYGPINWQERLSVAIPRIAGWYSGECHNGHTPLPHDRPDNDDAVWNDWMSATHSD